MPTRFSVARNASSNIGSAQVRVSLASNPVIDLVASLYDAVLDVLAVLPRSWTFHVPCIVICTTVRRQSSRVSDHISAELWTTNLLRLPALNPNFNHLLPLLHLLLALFNITPKSRPRMIRKAVKNGLSDVLSVAFRRKEKVDSDDVTLAGIDTSECSTLVDFVVHEPEAIVLSEDQTESSSNLLDNENRAWSSATSTINISSYTSDVYLTEKSNSNLSLLDEDECTWVMPRRRSNGRKKRTLFSSKVRTKPQNVSLQYRQCQLLDPEERSWV